MLSKLVLGRVFPDRYLKLKTAPAFMDKMGFENDNSGELRSQAGDTQAGNTQNEEQNERLFDLARRIAAELANCAPQKRALILAQAQTLWDSQELSPMASAAKAGCCDASNRKMAGAAQPESFMEVTSGWLVAVLNELPPLTRIEVLQLLSQLKENARFDRLAMGVQLETGE